MDGTTSATVYLTKSIKVQHSYGRDLLKYACIAEGDRVLDVGCGCGTLTTLIADQVGSSGQVVGIDPDIDRLKLAKLATKDVDNVTFYACKSVQFPLPSKKSKRYDAVISNVVLHWISTREKVVTFERIYEALKPGGAFVANISFKRSESMLAATSLLSKHDQESIAGNYYRENPAKLRKLLEDAGLEVEVYEPRYKEVNMGSTANFIQWMTGLYGGAYDFFTPYQRHGVQLETYDDGSVKHTSEGVTIVARKPLS